MNCCPDRTGQTNFQTKFRCGVLCLLSFFLTVFNSAIGQTVVDFRTTEVNASLVAKDLFADYKKAKFNPLDSLAARKALRTCLEQLFANGYLEARLDSLSNTSEGIVGWWTIGVKYDWAKLRTSPEDEYILSSAGVNDKFLRKQAFSPAAYAKVTADILTWCTNNGYPFALVKLDSVKIDQDGLDAKLNIDKGALTLLDSALIKGEVKIAPAYLYNYLSIKPGSPFNQSVLSKVNIRLQEIPFLASPRPFEIEFIPGRARPVLFLQSKKASQFNGVVGVQPDNANSGKVYVTGDVRLRLLNSFGKAELLDLNWSNPQPRSQDLKLKFSYPFLFSMPVGVDGSLTLYKKDSVFLELNREIGFRYFIAGNNSFRLFLGRKTSSLISTKGYENITTLPSFADVGVNTFGLGVQFQKLDYRLNPRKGFSVESSAGAGVRVIKKNARINPEVYDSLDLRNTQYKWETVFDFYIPVFRRSVLNLGAMGGWIQSDNIFTNELFRFGGLKTLRGFDEQSLLASTYIIGKAEYRFILEQNSYLLLFYNQAWYEDKSRQKLLTDIPYGFGAGITFETKLGIFSFTYALGSQQNNPVEFRTAKVHFGLVNYF